MTIEQVIENDIDFAIEQKKQQYNFDEEMENAENPCCEECANV